MMNKTRWRLIAWCIWAGKPAVRLTLRAATGLRAAQQHSISFAMLVSFMPADRLSLFKPVMAASLAWALAGCVPTGMGSTQVGQARTTLADGALTIAAPKGWCVDPKSLSDQRNGGFVLFGNCAAISGNPNDARATEPALLSATVGPPTIKDKNGKLSHDRLKRMETFFRSDIGRAALSRSGESADVKILHSEISHDMLLLSIQDRSKSGGPPIAQVYLRAIADLGGRITALSVMPLKDGEMSAAAQKVLITRFAEAIRSAN